MTSLRHILAAQSIFAGLSDAELETLTGCARNVRFARDDYLLREGDEATTFYVLREGRVALETHGAPHGQLLIETIEAGDVLGWSWLFPPYRWHFSGRAMEPVFALALDGACLRGKCEADHDLGYELMRRFASVIIERLQTTRVQLLDLYGAPRAVQGGAR
ncbi:MAG TPA: cyclic nucleotide-binding domain-containing protein [Ktedonobacterales bacterium]